MEYLGYTHKKPSLNHDGKWNYVDVIFSSTEEFNEATTKIMSILYKNDSDGMCIILDGKGNNYELEITHSTFDTVKNVIRVFPRDCKLLDQKNKINNNERKQSNPGRVTK